jgi:pimeloyl-ACP methyl ester carboxylesterase
MLLQLFQRLMVLVSLALFAAGAYLLWSWWDLREALDAGRIVEGDFDWRLWIAGALLALSLLGRVPVLWLLGRAGDDAARLNRLPGEPVRTPDGAVLHTEATGPVDAPVLVFVHGWGMDASTWHDARVRLATRYRVIAYDLAGLGNSKGPGDGRYSLERFADDLATVLDRLAPRRAIVIGHSIGGMIIQTFCRRHPQLLGGQVLGVVLENTTHTDPSQTTILGRLLGALRPVLIPLMWLDVVLFPIVWLMNWQSYLSGSTHLAMRFGGFGTRPSRAQLDQVARLATRNPPQVQAKGNIAMMRWEGAGDLGQIRVPTLVFAGGRDLVTVPRAGEALARWIPTATLRPMSQAGHMGPLELADAYNAEIARFADEVFTRGAAWADRRPPAVAPGPTGETRSIPPASPHAPDPGPA